MVRSQPRTIETCGSFTGSLIDDDGCCCRGPSHGPGEVQAAHTASAGTLHQQQNHGGKSCCCTPPPSAAHLMELCSPVGQVRNHPVFMPAHQGLGGATLSRPAAALTQPADEVHLHGPSCHILVPVKLFVSLICTCRCFEASLAYLLRCLLSAPPWTSGASSSTVRAWLQDSCWERWTTSQVGTSQTAVPGGKRQLSHTSRPRKAAIAATVVDACMSMDTSKAVAAVIADGIVYCHITSYSPQRHPGVLTLLSPQVKMFPRTLLCQLSPSHTSHSTACCHCCSNTHKRSVQQMDTVQTYASAGQ